MSESSGVASPKPEEATAKMHRRPIVGAAKTGSISRLQARAAAKSVKIRSTGGAARKIAPSSSKTGQSVSASVRERYLGHFGVGRSQTGAKKASGVKNNITRKSNAAARKVDGPVTRP